MLKAHAIHPLWNPLNSTLFSSVFNVPPGKCVVLHAAHLADWKERIDASEIRVPQIVCVRRLIHEFIPDDTRISTCGWIYDIQDTGAVKMVDHPIVTCNGPWQLSKCRNIGIIGVPGAYRLELNDTAAIGVAQVYAELFDLSSFAVQVKDLFFA